MTFPFLDELGVISTSFFLSRREILLSPEIHPRASPPTLFLPTAREDDLLSGKEEADPPLPFPPVLSRRRRTAPPFDGLLFFLSREVDLLLLLVEGGALFLAASLSRCEG